MVEPCPLLLSMGIRKDQGSLRGGREPWELLLLKLVVRGVLLKCIHLNETQGLTLRENLILLKENSGQLAAEHAAGVDSVAGTTGVGTVPGLRLTTTHNVVSEENVLGTIVDFCPIDRLRWLAETRHKERKHHMLRLADEPDHGEDLQGQSLRVTAGSHASMNDDGIVLRKADKPRKLRKPVKVILTQILNRVLLIQIGLHGIAVILVPTGTSKVTSPAKELALMVS